MYQETIAKIQHLEEVETEARWRNESRTKASAITSQMTAQPEKFGQRAYGGILPSKNTTALFAIESHRNTRKWQIPA